MVHDPSFWVALSFVAFCIVAFKPAFRKTKKFLEGYRFQISCEIRGVEEYVQEAKLSLMRAQDLSKTTQQEIEDIRKNAEIQIRHIKEELTQELALLSEHQKEHLSSHRDFLNDQVKKELRRFLLTQALQEIKEILSQAPGGISFSFQKAIQKAKKNINCRH